jgi:hypothetical protein
VSNLLVRDSPGSFPSHIAGAKDGWCQLRKMEGPNGEAAFRDFMIDWREAVGPPRGTDHGCYGSLNGWYAERFSVAFLDRGISAQRLRQ